MNRTNIIDDLTLLPVPPWWTNPWLVAALLAGMVVFGWALYRLLTRPPSAPRTPAPPPGPPPHDDALRRLAELRQRQPRPSAYEIAILVSDILRQFIEARFSLPIRFQTTREFLELAARRPELAREQREVLARFLGACDLMKFARQPATDSEQTALLDTAEQFIRGC